MVVGLMLIFSILSHASMASAGPASSDALNLTGTIVGTFFNGAVLKDSKGEQLFYRLYDVLPDGSQIVDVRSDSISIKGTDGRRYEMYISHERTLLSADQPPAGVNNPPPANTDAENQAALRERIHARRQHIRRSSSGE